MEQLAAVTAAGKSSPTMEVVRLTNELRARHGAGPLRVEHKLMRVARSRAKASARRGGLSHQGWFATLIRFGFRKGRGAGENLAFGQDSPSEVVQAWRGSDGHFENLIRGSFDTIGVGHVVDKRGVDYWAQVFGSGRQ